MESQPISVEQISTAAPQITVEMRQRYLQRRAADLNALEQSIAECNFDRIAGIAHQIKGNAATFNYPQLQPIAAEIETAAERRDVFTIARHMATLRAWLGSMLPDAN